MPPHLATPNHRTLAPSASSTSQTITTPETSNLPQHQAPLRLRGVHPPRRRIQWAEDVIDNEGLGRKSSKGVFCADAILLHVSLHLFLLIHELIRASMLHLPWP